MGLRRARGAVYDLKYHLVWVPKYRRMVLRGRLAQRLQEIFVGIAARYEFEIDTQEIMDDHVHLFLSAPPRYAPAEVVQILRSISARKVFEEFPDVKRALWGGELWNDGYFVRSVGDKVTAEVIRNYMKHQRDPEQLGLDL
ncbi:MAG: IS200/IS605 family transposase [Nitrospirota bacterium]